MGLDHQAPQWAPPSIGRLGYFPLTFVRTSGSLSRTVSKAEKAIMNASARHQQIVALVREKGMVQAQWLADHFGVTVQTVRRDIDQLASSSLVRRYRGGVAAPSSIENRSEEHTSELQSLMRISYAVFCLKKKKKKE